MSGRCFPTIFIDNFQQSFFITCGKYKENTHPRERLSAAKKKYCTREKREKYKKGETAVMLKLIIRDRNTNGRETRGKKTT